MAFRSTGLVLSVLLVGAAQAGPAFPQGAEGQIAGVVSDTTGARVPGAAVTITNEATGATKVVTTAADGRYSASLAAGVYSVSVVLKGFGVQAQKGLKLEAGATHDASFTLAARLSEEVTVTSQKRESALQTTPIAATVLTGEDTANAGVTVVDQLQFITPSAVVNNFGQGIDFNIRGIGKAEHNSQTTTGVITYRDGVATFPGYFTAEPTMIWPAWKSCADRRARSWVRMPPVGRCSSLRTIPSSRADTSVTYRPTGETAASWARRARSIYPSATRSRRASRSTRTDETASTTSKAPIRAMTA
jgi:hypothetical protein